MMNPNRRYVLTAEHAEFLKDRVETVSPLKSQPFLRPLTAKSRLHGAKILVERRRDCGIGDMLFLTGPLSFIREMSGASAQIDLYALSDRSPILAYHPALPYGPLAGPIYYDHLPLYNFHWFVDQATEHDEEPDQSDVYDCLFRQMGMDPANVPAKYKRPSMALVEQDFRDLLGIDILVNHQKSIDLRIVPYIVLAPLALSSLRIAPYRLWLELAAALADEGKAVVFVGRAAENAQIPSGGMAYGDFVKELEKLAQGRPIINLLNQTTVRPTAALIGRARAFVGLDSGLLYVAQALRVPAVSLWGALPPHVRLKHDEPYLRSAIWNRQTCPASPCFSWRGFPVNKCPDGQAQRTCAPLASVLPQQILEALGRIDAARAVVPA